MAENNIHQSQSVKRIHLKGKKILAPFSICRILLNSTSTSNNDDTKIQGTITYNTTKEIIVQWEKTIKNSAEISLQEEDLFVLRYRFPKTKNKTIEFGQYVKEYQDYEAKKNPKPKRRRLCLNKSNNNNSQSETSLNGQHSSTVSTSISASITNCEQQNTSEQLHQHAYETGIRRRGLVESLETTGVLGSESENSDHENGSICSNEDQESSALES